MGWAVATHYAGQTGDPVVEAIVSMPGLTETGNAQQEQSAIIHQVCPAVTAVWDEYTNTTTTTMDATNNNATASSSTAAAVLTTTRPQTYHLNALQRFVRNCAKRQRVEQTMAWQERNL